MSALFASIARRCRAFRANRACPASLAGQRTRRAAVAVPLLAAMGLAVGCASASSGTAAGGTAAGGTAASGTPASGAVHASAPATPVTPGPPAPTVSGGPVPVGGVACASWPSNAVHAALPASFVPVSVERCVNGVQAIPGKGLWTTATLQRSTGDLSDLVSALRQHSVPRKPGIVCPAIAVIPPQVVLANAAGQTLIPQLPVGGCGLIAAAVLTELNRLHWQPVSVRLIAPVPGATSTAPTTPGTAPHSPTSGSGGHVQPQ